MRYFLKTRFKKNCEGCRGFPHFLHHPQQKAEVADRVGLKRTLSQIRFSKPAGSGGISLKKLSEMCVTSKICYIVYSKSCQQDDDCTKLIETFQRCLNRLPVRR
ncbi:hypothetical protein J2125_000746 [Erwinia toletana]|uniref:Uncharacterized protein n=1 Tax=Winslowiella toletana TaxID=92490 RepID=A0ABS4P4H6_9GAMM|nr:hypothetical protein [Winslowiella toletana]MBP2167554.1 hypothetical protein [Winslowiella toletana]